MKGYLALVCWTALLLAGCSSWDWRAIRSQGPEQTESTKSTTPTTRLVGDMAAPFGTHPVRVEAVGLISGLPGTGSDPPPSAQRGALLAEMQTRGVKSPSTLLTSKSFAMVMVQAYLRPGIQKGDHFDVEVRVPGKSETTSLRGGWLLETRLKELAVLDHEVHGGHPLALAQGPVLVNPAGEANKDKVSLGRGRVLGGAVALKSRPLGLVLNPNNQSVVNASRIADAVNKRFHITQRGIQNGVAKAKTEKYVELAVHPRYKDNIDRYIKVVRALAIQEKPTEQAARLSSLKMQLLDSATSATAARQLEAIGRDALPILRDGITSADREVRFYAAEALAYLDQREAAQPLGQIARDEPAFRVFALGALSAMEDQAARDELTAMFGLSSAETRYGAFRALWAMNPDHPAVQGDPSVKDFSYYVLDMGESPMIHVTHSRRPEVVLFGARQYFQTPIAVNAGPHIQITSPEPGQLCVSKYMAGQADQKRIVSTSVDEAIRAVVDLGGTYPDVVQALEEAKANGAMNSRFEVDALPTTGRAFERLASDAADAKSAEGGKKPATEAHSPVPGLFSRSDGPARQENTTKEGAGDDKSADSEGKKDSGKGVFAKMLGRDAK